MTIKLANPVPAYLHSNTVHTTLYLSAARSHVESVFTVADRFVVARCVYARPTYTPCVCVIVNGRRCRDGGAFDARQLNRKRVNTRQRDVSRYCGGERRVGDDKIERLYALYVVVVMMVVEGGDIGYRRCTAARTAMIRTSGSRGMYRIRLGGEKGEPKR